MRAAVALVALGLAGCNALGGIQPEAVKAVADAGGGCIDVESLVLGKGGIMVGSSDKGVIRNGELNITCPGGRTMTIRETAVPRVAPIKVAP